MATSAQKFKQFVSLNYGEQAKAFLNAYWQEHAGNGEEIWGFAQQFYALDLDNGKEGRDLDEFNAHRFLERLGETKTVKQMREELRAIDIDFNKRMALLEYLLFKYRRPIDEFVRRPQGENTAEIQEAQRQLEVAQRSLEIAKKAVEDSDIAARRADEEAKIAAIKVEESRQRTAEAAQAEEELRAALHELHQQENEYNQKKVELERKSEDTNLGVVQRNKAKNELAQHLGEDPLPLRRAKLTTEAATKKAEKAKLAAIDAERAAEVARDNANKAAAVAREKAAEARQKAVECEDALNAAERYLEEVKSRPGGGQGAIWWIERELAEVRKYLPPRKNLR